MDDILVQAELLWGKGEMSYTKIATNKNAAVIKLRQ